MVFRFLCTAEIDADRTKTGKRYDPYLNAPTHGGDFNAANYNQPSVQSNDTKLSHTWSPALSHGGDFDANRFKSNHSPGQSQGQQTSSPEMASNLVQGGSSGRNGSNRLNPIHSPSPTRELLGVGLLFPGLQISQCIADLLVQLHTHAHLTK